MESAVQAIVQNLRPVEIRFYEREELADELFK
jgi:hypothetical protein